MAPDTDRPYRGVAAADRVAERRARIVGAARDLLGGVHWTALTVESVCDRARVSKRFFYESFVDRDALLVALLDATIVSVRDRVVSAAVAAAPDREAQVRAVVGAVVSTLAADAAGARLYAGATGSPALRERRDAAFDEFVDVLGTEVLGLEIDAARRAALLITISGTTEVIARWFSGDVALSAEELGEVLSEVGGAVADRLLTGR